MSTNVLIFVGLIFATAFLLVQGLTIPVFGENAQARKRLKKKLDEIQSADAEGAFTSLLREKYLRKLSPWERQIEKLPRMEQLADLIEQSGNKFLAYRVVLFALIIGLLAIFLSWVLFRIWYVSFFAGGMVAYLPFMKISMDRRKRFMRFEEQLPDAIETMTRALRAGHPFSAALKMISDDFDDPISGEFEMTFADINYGNDVRRAMLGLLGRVPTVTVMALVTAVLVQKETGGNLAEILERISGVIRGRFRLQRKIKTLSAEGRMSAWVLAMVPLFLFAVLMITSPDYLPILLDDPRGQKMIAVAFVMAGIGVFWIRRILRIEV